MKLHTDTVTCHAADSIETVAKLIRDNKVRHVYVIEHKKLLGIVGGIDITNKIVAEGRDYKTLTAKDVMNKVEALVEGKDIEYAYAIMRNFNTFMCPVVDSHGELKGYYKFAEVCDAINSKLEHKSN